MQTAVVSSQAVAASTVLALGRSQGEESTQVEAMPVQAIVAVAAPVLNRSQGKQPVRAPAAQDDSGRTVPWADTPRRRWAAAQGAAAASQ